MDLKRNLFGQEYYEDTSGHAGQVAAVSGKKFEKTVAKTIRMHGGTYEWRPRYTNHVGKTKCQGDILLHYSNNTYHVECKKLGRCESHLEKLSYITENLRDDCYDYPFILVYSVAPDCPPHKLEEVNGYRRKIESLGGVVYEYNEFSQWLNV